MYVSLESFIQDWEWDLSRQNISKRLFICGSSQTIDPLYTPVSKPDKIAFLQGAKAVKLYNKLKKRVGEFNAKKMIYYKYGAWLENG